MVVLDECVVSIMGTACQRTLQVGKLDLSRAYWELLLDECQDKQQAYEAGPA